MIGHLNKKYADFGWAAARFDDLLNVLPARITTVLILIVNWRFDILLEVTEDAPKELDANHIDEVIVLLWKVWGLAFFPAFLIALF